VDIGGPPTTSVTAASAAVSLATVFIVFSLAGKSDGDRRGLTPVLGLVRPVRRE
jgi:hypothetical protein